ARREAGPRDLACEAQVVEPLGAVAGDAGSQDVALPGCGGDLEALEGHDGVAKARASAGARSRRQAVALEEEAHEVLRRDGGDLAPQAVEGEAVDAREKAPVADL